MFVYIKRSYLLHLLYNLVMFNCILQCNYVCKHLMNCHHIVPFNIKGRLR